MAILVTSWYNYGKIVKSEPGTYMASNWKAFKRFFSAFTAIDKGVHV